MALRCEGCVGELVLHGVPECIQRLLRHDRAPVVFAGFGADVFTANGIRAYAYAALIRGVQRTRAAHACST